MAELVLTDGFVSINSVDMSDHFMSLNVEPSVDLQEITSFGDLWRNRIGGLKDWTATLEFHQDFDASAVDALLWPLFGVATDLVFRAVRANVLSATNPEYRGSGILESYPPIAGSVGDALTGSITFQGNGELTRHTT